MQKRKATPQEQLLYNYILLYHVSKKLSIGQKRKNKFFKASDEFQTTKERKVHLL